MITMAFGGRCIRSYVWTEQGLIAQAGKPVQGYIFKVRFS